MNGLNPAAVSNCFLSLLDLECQSASQSATPAQLEKKES